MKFFITILLLSGYSFCFAQQKDTFQLVKTYPVPVSEAVFDHLDNLYLVTAQEQLKKYNASGDSVAVYNNVRRFGRLHAIDVSNPLKLLLFYKDFSTVVILDRLLSVRSTVDLRRYNILQASAIGLSYDNNIWLFDSFENKLKKIDEQGKVLQETPDFRTLFGQTIVPQQIIDNDNQVHLYDPAQGLFLFDHFGTFKRKIPIAQWSSVQVGEKLILGIHKGGLSRYTPATFQESRLAFPHNFLPYYKYSLSQNRLIAFSKDSVYVYSFRY